MAIPHRCPVCNGSGKVVECTGTAINSLECPACHGACIVWEETDSTEKEGE